MRKPPIPKRFLGAFKVGHRAPSKPFIEEDLSYELLNRILNSSWQDLEAVAQLDWLTKFNNEFHKSVIKKGDPEALHSNDDLRKDCYSRENARNRDMMNKDDSLSLDELYWDVQSADGYSSVARHNRSGFMDKLLSNQRSPTNHETVMVELVTIKRSKINTLR